MMSKIDMKEFVRGYYCAVASLLREEGSVTTGIRSLYKQGGWVELADDEDRELFKFYGLDQAL
jgi:hypothetical protein